LTTRSGINRFFPDPGSQPQIFESLVTIFWVKSLLENRPKFFLHHFQSKIIFNFVKFVAKYKGMTTHFFHPSLLLQF
jgi:hypothetical protein